MDIYGLFQKSKKWKWIFTVLLVLFLALTGQILGDFWIHTATEALIMSLYAVSFSLLYGQIGMLSFGQGAYFGVGAYGFALAMTRLSAPFVICMLIGVLVAGLWAWIAGYFCVRRVGIYFAIMTVVMAQVTFYVLFQWYSFTGGDNGIQGLFPTGILRNPRNFFYFTLVVVSGALFVFRLILKSPFGLSLRCVRENIIRSESVGVEVRRHIHKAFIISGLYAGLAGVLYAPFNVSIVPQMADWNASGQAVFMGILGGVSYVFGSLVGSVIWVFLHAFVTGFTVYWSLVIGFIVFMIIFFMPGGLMGLTGVVTRRTVQAKESR